MNNVNVIISGNLTGFSRFYLSPGASEIMSESKFKFDNYDYLDFLKPGGKVYSISFSPKHIAASLITPILDSFRRPGTLVVSVLIPRKSKVAYASTQNSPRALYDLLNEINDRFYEKNYQNGMINQNPAVLMQDYYADILARYCYVPDLKQNDVSLWVDTDSLSKKIGYIASSENNIPLYLASLCRKSYDGCHYVFIAPNAPQNIDEEPEEVQLYRVRIGNNNMLLPEPVKLTQNIYPFQPGEGELDFDKNFTYQQALAGQCQQVSAVLNGETIEINYRFRQQEKKIRFEFYDVETNAHVDISLIRPSIESDNTNRILTSDSCIFLGSEIYSRFTIVSKGNGYHIIDTILDLRYISDGATVRVAVSQGCRIQKIFNVPYDMPKTISLRSYTGEQKVFFDVKEVFNEKIPGQLSDWTYEISADGYEITKGNLSSLVDPNSTFMMTPKLLPATNTFSSGPAVANPGAPKIINEGGPLGGNREKKPQKVLNWKKVAAVALAAIILILGVALVISVIKHKKEKDEDEQLVTIAVDFRFNGKSDKNSLSSEEAKKHGITLEYAGTDDGISCEASGDYSYIITAASASKASLKFKVYLKGVEIQEKEFEEAFVDIKQKADEEMKCTYAIGLNVSLEQIESFNYIQSNLHDKKDKGINDSQKKDFLKQIDDNVSHDGLKDILKKMLNEIEIPIPVQDNSIDIRYDAVYLDVDAVGKIKKDRDLTEAERERIEAIKTVLTCVKNKEFDKVSDDLIEKLSKHPQKVKLQGKETTFSQQDAIKSLKNVYSVLPEKSFNSMLEDKHESFLQIYAMIAKSYSYYIINNE